MLVEAAMSEGGTDAAYLSEKGEIIETEARSS